MDTKKREGSGTARARKEKESMIIYEDSDPWYVRHGCQIGAALGGLLFAVLLMLPFMIGCHRSRENRHRTA